MPPKKSKRKSCRAKSRSLCIVAREEDNFEWVSHFDVMQIPQTVTFYISGILAQIEKIHWDFCGTPIVINLYKQTDHLFPAKMDNSTLYVGASVFVDGKMFVPAPFAIGTLKKKKKKNYVNPIVFRDQIIRYYKTNVLTEDLMESLDKIATRLSFATNFINYTYRDEMIGDAKIRMIKALQKRRFDPDKGNPFSYFSKIAFRAYIHRIKKEKQAREAISRYQEYVYERLENTGAIPYQHGKPRILSTDGSDENNWE